MTKYYFYNRIEDVYVTIEAHDRKNAWERLERDYGFGYTHICFIEVDEAETFL